MKKRWFAALLCGLLVLSGCQRPAATQPGTEETDASEPVETTVPEDTTQGTTTPPTTESEPQATAPVANPAESALVAVSLSLITESVEAEDGTVIFTYSYPDVSVYLPDMPDAAQAIETYLDGEIADAADTAEELRNWAEEDYAGATEWTPYTCEISYTPQRVDQEVLSLSGQAWDFAGGVHPNSTLISANFAVETGELLTLRDILTGETMTDALYSLVMDGLEQYANTLGMEESPYLEGYADVVAGHFDLDNSASNAWYFNDQGMVFYFSADEIGPHALGAVEIPLSYRQLQGVIQEAYLPESVEDSGTFSINAAKMEEIDADQFAEVLSVTLEAEGENVVIFSSETLHHVRLIQGNWTTEDTFVPTQTIFAANRLAPNELLSVRTFIPDAMPNLRLEIGVSETEVRTYYIFQSGEDGGILLLDSPV